MDILGFKVTATRTGTVFHFPHHDDNMSHDRFLVKIKHGNKQINFQFFGSHQDFLAHKIKLDDQDLVNAFYSFLSDAEAGTHSFEDFIAEFGYEINKQSKAIHKAVVGARKKASTLGLNDEDIYDLMNKLQEEYSV